MSASRILVVFGTRPEALAVALARTFGPRVRIVEPYAATLPAAFAGTGAQQVDLDTALATCPTLAVLVDHELFRCVPLAERVGHLVLDTRGILPDQPAARIAPPALRLAS